MKKMLAMVLTVISIYSYAATPVAGDKVSPRIQASLEKEFTGARYIVWESLEKENIYMARFVYNNEQLNAFFDQQGTLLATGRLITQAALPLMVSKTLNSNYAGYEFKDATEYTRDGETSYLVNLENQKHKLVLQIYGGGSAYVVKKTKKNL
jgi:hypothetical protein